MKFKPIVLSLFDRSGIMVEPWVRNGFDCHILDLAHNPGEHKGTDGITRIGIDFNDWQPSDDFHPSIVFGFPPCTDLAVSGARHFEAKGPDRMARAVDLFRRVEHTMKSLRCAYMIENPKTILPSVYRKPDHEFQPADYAMYGDDEDCYTKQTYIWSGNKFIFPRKISRHAHLGSKMHRIGRGPNRSAIRSLTPRGFAFAVFLANATRTIEHAANLAKFPDVDWYRSEKADRLPLFGE